METTEIYKVPHMKWINQKAYIIMFNKFEAYASKWYDDFIQLNIIIIFTITMQSFKVITLSLTVSVSLYQRTVFAMLIIPYSQT